MATRSKTHKSTQTHLEHFTEFVSQSITAFHMTVMFNVFIFRTLPVAQLHQYASL